MKKILVNTLKPGMAFNRPVYIDPDNVLVEAYEALKASDIDRLTKWNIQEVETEGEPAKPKIRQEIVVPEGPEKDDITRVKDELKRSSLEMDVLDGIVRNGEKLLEEAYGVIAEEKAFQISRIRDLAEKITTLLHNNPLCFMHLYYLEGKNTLFRHLVITSIFGAKLGAALGFSQPKNIELVFSILLMDVGMMLLPLSVRMKEGKLNPDEIAKLHTHPLRGYQLLTKNVKAKNSIALVALQHQEHYDGSGYPQHISGEDISEYARIAMIADSYTAILEDRTYRSRKLPYDAMKELLALGIFYYDPNYMRSFLNTLSVYPVGSLVEMSDKRIGIVVNIVPEKPMRPIVYVIRNSNGERPENAYFIHLLYHTDLFIAKGIFAEDAGISYKEEMDLILQSG